MLRKKERRRRSHFDLILANEKKNHVKELENIGDGC
jgi:hypothetical protein